MSRIGDKFSELRSRAAAGFIPYLTFGDPEADWTVPLLEALDRAGADLIEVGVPFSDPMADGPLLQRAEQVACLESQEPWSLAADPPRVTVEVDEGRPGRRRQGRARQERSRQGDQSHVKTPPSEWRPGPVRGAVSERQGATQPMV